MSRGRGRVRERSNHNMMTSVWPTGNARNIGLYNDKDLGAYRTACILSYEAIVATYITFTRSFSRNDINSTSCTVGLQVIRVL
jgi:hypothetical protein